MPMPMHMLRDMRLQVVFLHLQQRNPGLLARFLLLEILLVRIHHRMGVFH